MSPAARLTLISLIAIANVAHAGSADDALSEYEDVRVGVVAGVRSVGNGGGYAEMQAEFINLRLHIWALNAPPAITIEIEPHCAPQPIQVVSTTVVRLSSCALYRIPAHSTAAQPKLFHEIATWVLASRLMTQGQSFESSYIAASQQFRNFSQTEDSLEISLTSGNFLFHDLSVAMNGTSNKVLSVEGREKTYDVTDQSFSTLRCSTAKPVTWSTRGAYARASGSAGALVSSSVAWSCVDGSKWEAQLLTSFESKQGEVVAGSIITQIVQRRQVAK